MTVIALSMKYNKNIKLIKEKIIKMKNTICLKDLIINCQLSEVHSEKFSVQKLISIYIIWIQCFNLNLP